MREHPIPQDVTGYKFHIVGNMTLKQFLEVAGGVVIAVILFKTGLPNIIKWPFILISLATGSLSAFVPVAGRPFDQWIITFFQVIYKPTLYYWKRKAHIPDVFKYQSKNSNQTLDSQPINLTPQRHQRVHEYLASIKQPSQKQTQVTVEQKKEAQILSYFNETKKEKKPSQTTTSESAKQKNTPVGKNEPIATQQASSTDPINSTKMSPKTMTTRTAAGVIFNQDLPFPSTPVEPNKIVGMILTKNRDLVPNAIVEVKDRQGVIERAVKTNALGQFFITTPLKNGTYILWVGKEGLNFQPVSLTLNNKIMPPLEIIAS